MNGALKVAAGVALALAAVLAVVAYRYSSQVAQQAEQARAAQQAAPAAAQELAVVALKPLEAYQPIARDGVALVPVAVVPPDRYTSIDDVVNKIPLVDVDAGAPVTQRYFRDGSVLSRIVPTDHQAISVEVDDIVAVGGFLRPGDIVDVLLYLRNQSSKEPAQARVLLRDVRVLAYLERIIDRPEGISDADAQKTRKRTAVLSVPAADTTRLMLGASAGDLRLALHGQTEVAEGAGNGAPQALAASDLRTRERPITLDELARIRQPAAQAPPPKIEVLRGSAVEMVTPQ